MTAAELAKLKAELRRDLLREIEQRLLKPTIHENHHHLDRGLLPRKIATTAAGAGGAAGDVLYIDSAENIAKWGTTGSAAPAGPAGGDLSGSYPNPSVVDDSHTHDTRYYTETETDSLLATNATNDRARANHTGTQTASTISDFAAAALAAILAADGSGSTLDADLLDAQSGAYYLARGNHTGTQTASTISDFSTAVQAISYTEAEVDSLLSTYLKLDASNDPITDSLEINKASGTHYLGVKNTTPGMESKIFPGSLSLFGAVGDTFPKVSLVASGGGQIYFADPSGGYDWSLGRSGVGIATMIGWIRAADDPVDDDDLARKAYVDSAVGADVATHVVGFARRSEVLYAQDLAQDALREATRLDALMDRKVERELAEKADLLHTHGELYTDACKLMAGMSAADSGAPTHTSSGGWQKVGSGGGTLTWTSDFDKRPPGVSAQVDTGTNKRLDVRRAGLYQVSYGATFTAITDGKLLDVAVYKNGALIAAGGLTTGVACTPSIRGSKVLSLASGDYLELYAYQNDSVSEAYFTTAGYQPFIQMIYLGSAT